MKAVSGNIISLVIGFVGLMLFGFGALSLQSSGKLASDRNPLAIQRSAYGKLLARMSESTIDRVWHMGIEQITPHGASGCGHDHAPGETCNHGESTDTFTFHVDEDGNVEEEDNHPAEEDHRGHNHETDLHEHTEACDHDHAHGETCNNEGSTAESEESTLLGSSPKEWLQNASIVRYKRTNPRSLSDRHLMEVKKDVEQMLLRSYKMDPAHYGAYNSYHLFLTTHEFGGTEHTKNHAKKIAEHTLEVISRETEDPEAWLTAAAAGSNLYFMEAEDAAAAGKQVPVDRLKRHRDRIGYCLNQFATLQETALKSGSWDAVPMKRQLEIESRSRFALKTFEQFGAMITRAETEKASIPDGEVVGGIVIP